MAVKYTASFYSRKGIRWQTDIDVKGYTGEAREVWLAGEEPVMIEWSEAERTDVMRGSTATLRLIAQADREFFNDDFLSTEPDRTTLKVYRAGTLYWAGRYDPEQYEEPFSEKAGYEVQLSFTDLGCLDRLKWTDGTTAPLLTIEQIVTTCLRQTALGAVMTWGLSTSVPGSALSTQTGIGARVDNFRDEDGEPMTLAEVIEATLQPLGAMVVQQAGRWQVIDAHYLATTAPYTALTWDADDQMIGLAPVYNNVIITFSPYADAEPWAQAFGWKGGTNASKLNGNELTNNGQTVGDTTYYDYYWGYNKGGGAWDYTDRSFRNATTQQLCGLAQVGTGRTFRHIPLYGGQEHEGAVVMFCTGGHGDLASGRPQLVGWSAEKAQAGLQATVRTPALTTQRLYLPPMPAGNNYKLLLQLPLLFDPRYNPYEQAARENESGNYENQSKWLRMVLQPVSIALYTSATGGTLTHAYSNASLAVGAWSGLPAGAYSSQKGWVTRTAELPFGSAYLAYYDPDDHEKAALGGWTTNNHFVGFYADPNREQTRADGELIEYPPAGGWLEVKVYSQLGLYHYDGEPTGDDQYKNIRWWLYEHPTIKILDGNSQTLAAATLDDQVTECELLSTAREELTLDTKCGTLEEASPVARGQYYDMRTQTPLTAATRAGQTARVEVLLGASIFSHHAARHLRLSGTAQLSTIGIVCTAPEYPQRRLLMEARTDNPIDDTMEVTAVEVSADVYSVKS